jgi:hypothetical protein
MRTSSLLVTFLLGTICAVASFGADNSLGTWKLNASKSTFSPPQPVKSLTTRRESSGAGVKVTTTGEFSDGTPIESGYTAKYDGTPAPVDGTAWDTISIKQVDADTFTTETRRTGGKYHATARVKISADGKTMTVTANGTNVDGKPFTSTSVYEKQ